MKGTVNKVKIQAPNWEVVVVIYISNKGLSSKIQYKKLSECYKTTTQFVRYTSKDFNQYLTKEPIGMVNKHMKRNVRIVTINGLQIKSTLR